MPKLKQRSDGYYRAWYKGKQFLGKTIAEAEAKRNEYKYECEHGIEQLKQITLFNYIEQWLPVAKANVTKHTYNHYAHIFEILIDICGDKQISAVMPSDIKKAWVQMSDVSQSYINKARYLYTDLFNSAIEEGYCRINPVKSKTAKPHKGTKGTHRCLTDEEIKLIETTQDKMQVVAMFMLKAGLGRGEVLALQKSDIHDDRIYITKAVQFGNNQASIGRTKTESSVRSVPLFAPLKPFVKDIGKYAFTNKNGELASKKVFEYGWSAYMKTLSQEAKHNISFRCHDLRHTFITKCRDAGIDIHIVMQWVGHSSEKMILQIYDHPSINREELAILRLNTQ